MSEQPQSPTIWQSIISNARLLGLFAAATAIVLAGTYSLTKARIAEVQRQVEAKALQDIVAHVTFDNDLTMTAVQLTEPQRQLLNLKNPAKAHFATLAGEIQAIILPAVAPDGYSGAIRMLIGIDRQLRITGLRVTDHSETPGLGDKVNLKKSDWVLSFNDRGFDNVAKAQWAVRKDGGSFDAFTGATITPRAVIKQASKTLELIHNSDFFTSSDFFNQPLIDSTLIEQ